MVSTSCEWKPRKIEKIKVMRAVCDLRSGPNPHKCDWIGCAILKANHKRIPRFLFFQFSRIRSLEVKNCEVPCILLTYFFSYSWCESLRECVSEFNAELTASFICA